jgi:hypothetical protein
LPAEQIGHHYERARRPDIDGDDTALARIHIQKRRLAATLRFPGRTLEHRAILDQLIDEHADGAAPSAHEPGEVGS